MANSEVVPKHPTANGKADGTSVALGIALGFLGAAVAGYLWWPQPFTPQFGSIRLPTGCVARPRAAFMLRSTPSPEFANRDQAIALPAGTELRVLELTSTIEGELVYMVQARVQGQDRTGYVALADGEFDATCASQAQALRVQAARAQGR